MGTLNLHSAIGAALMASSGLTPTTARPPIRRLRPGHSAAALVAVILIAPLLLVLPNAASSDPVPGIGPDMTRTVTWNFDEPANFTTTNAEVNGGYGSLKWSTYSFDHDSEADYSTGMVMSNIDISSEPGSIIIDTHQETIHTLSLQPGIEGVDAYIREETPDANSGVTANIVIDGQSGKQQRPIMWFDLSSLPSNAAILDGSLWLYLRNGKESPVYYTAYAMSHLWYEFTVTWNSYGAELPWTTQGGDFDPFPFCKGVLENTGGWHHIDLSRMVDLWSTDRLGSFGFILVPDPTGSESSKTFVSSDETTYPERRPMLVLNYTLKDEEGNYESDALGPEGNNTIFTTASWTTGVHSALTDEFSGTDLSSRWAWTNEPYGVGDWDVGDTIPGWLHMSGLGNNLLGGTNVDAHYLHENVTGPFEAITYVSTSFTINTMGAGMLMLDDNSNWLAAVLVGTGAGATISTIATEMGSSTTPAEASWAGLTSAYLRMLVNGSSVTVFYCSDGIEWIELVTYNYSKPLSTMVQVGLCLYSGGSLSTPSANFDFLRVKPLIDHSSTQMMIRLGDSDVPGDPSWGSWIGPVASPYVIDTGAKYIQYRVTLTTELEWYSPSFDGFYCGNQMYSPTGVIETMDHTVDYLRRWLSITCAEELNGGSVTYSYSTDHGDSWFPLLAGVSNSISDTAPYMMLRMELATTDTLVTPSVDSITAQYSVAASSFHVSAPSTVVAGEEFSVTVEARDENNATIDHWTGMTELTAVDESGALPASGSLLETVAYISTGGTVVIWDEAYTVAETIRIMVSAEDAFGLSAPITVLPGIAHHLNITPEPDEVPEYSQIAFKAMAHDIYCNPVTGKEYAWHADESIGTLNSTSGQFITLQTGQGRQDGYLTVTVEEISHSIFLKVVPPMYPPEIAGSIEEQIWPEDHGSWSLNISSMVSDFEDAWMDMRWYVTNEWLVTVSGENKTADMTVNLTTKPNLFGSNVLRLVVVDSDGMTASTEFLVTITPVNDPPSIDHIASLAVTYDIEYEFDFRHHISDVDNAVDELTLSVDAASEAYATVRWLMIGFLYPAALNGTQQFVTVRVWDGMYASSTTLIVSISSNKVPFSRDIPAVSLDQGQTMAGVLDLSDYFDDLDDSMLFYSVHSNHVGVTIQPNHTVDLAAPIHWWGVEYVIFTASDDDGARCEEVMMVTVLHVNQPPSIEGVPDLMVMYELRYDFDLTPYISDADNPIDTLGIAADSSYIAVIGTAISLLFPRSMDGQTVTVVLSVSDGELTDSCSITVGVSANRPPEPLSLPDHEFLEDGEVPYPVGENLQSLFVDPDGHSSGLAFYAFTCTSDVNVTAEPNGQGDWYVWFEAVDDWNGICRLTIRAVDPHGALAERTVLVNVIPQPDQPLLKEFEPITIQAGTQKMLDLTQYASDPDSETEKFVFIAICDDGNYADVRGGVLVLSFPEDFLEGNANSRVTSVEVTVIDEDGYATKGVVLVTVTKAPSSFVQSQRWLYVSLILMGGLVLGLGMVALGMRRRPFVIRDMMLIHNDGFLISRHASPKEGEIDEQVLSSMLTAVLNFVEDSMAAGENSLKTFGFRDYHVMVERGNRVFTAIAYEGDMPAGIDETLDGFLATVEKIYKKKLEHWSGDIETDFAGVEMLIQSFVEDHSRRRKVSTETVWKTRASDKKVKPRHVMVPYDSEELEAEALERKARFTRKGRTKEPRKDSVQVEASAERPESK
jgi:regulation of enolase protein 1 (concanavalin A-like superfamily)